MVQQKVDLGLLSADLGFEEFAPEPPEFLILFADYDVSRAQLTTRSRACAPRSSNASVASSCSSSRTSRSSTTAALSCFACAESRS